MRIKKYKAPKQTSLPESINDRQLLDSLLKEAVEHKNKVKHYNDLLKEVKQTLSDEDGKLNLDPKYVTKLIKAKYDLFKTETEATNLQSSVDDVKILSNKGE
jgi:hypothetical protein